MIAEVNRDATRRRQPYSADDFPLPEPGVTPQAYHAPPPTEAQMKALNKLYPGPGGG